MWIVYHYTPTKLPKIVAITKIKMDKNPDSYLYRATNEVIVFLYHGWLVMKFLALAIFDPIHDRPVHKIFYKLSQPSSTYLDFFSP